MGIFDFLKKRTVSPQTKADTRHTESPEKLTEDGELPWGWVTRHKDFVDKISGEYTYFLHNWTDNMYKSPLKHYEALKSFVIYMQGVEKLCKSKSECYEFWFYNILASKDYIAKREKELEELTANFDEEMEKFNKRNKELSDLDERLVKILKENPNILQTDLIKMFDPIVKQDVSSKLYFMEKDGKLKRTKSGRSYILNYEP